MPFYKSFASDNYSGVHPEIMESIIRANVNHVSSYGNDPYSEAAVSKFKEHFGDTKNGLMIGEAIVFFDKSLATDFKYIRKQGMQLGSKMRFIAAQFEALLSNDLWLRNARNANDMAKFLAGKIENIPEIKITQEVEANAVFAIIPREYISTLQEVYSFYVWSEEKSEVRWMTAFDTTKEDIENFVAEIEKICFSKL